MAEHQRNLTNKNKNSLLFKNTEATDHSFYLNAPEVLAYEWNKFNRLFMESCYSKTDSNSINRSIDMPPQYFQLSKNLLKWIYSFMSWIIIYCVFVYFDMYYWLLCINDYYCLLWHVLSLIITSIYCCELYCVPIYLVVHHYVCIMWSIICFFYVFSDNFSFFISSQYIS